MDVLWWGSHMHESLSGDGVGKAQFPGMQLLSFRGVSKGRCKPMSSLLAIGFIPEDRMP